MVERFALDHVHHLRADATLGPPFLDDDGAVGLRDRSGDRRLVERPQRAQVDDLRRDAFLLGELLGGLERDGHGLGVADQSYVLAGPLDVGLADRHDVLALGHLPLDVVQHLALEHDHGVVVADRRLEQAFGVGGRGRRHDLEAGDMTQPALPRLRVLRPELEGRPVRAPEHDRDRELPARLVQDLGRRVHDLVERQDREVPRHELDHRPEPRHGRPHADPREPELRDGRVHHAHRAELFEQPAAHLVRALVDPDFLAHQEDVAVALHLFPQRLIQRVTIGQGRHGLSR